METTVVGGFIGFQGDPHRLLIKVFTGTARLLMFRV